MMQESSSNEDSRKVRSAELYQRLAALREEQDKLDSEAREWAGKRDSLHIEIRKLRTKATKLRQERDTLNVRVQQLKTMREEANENRREKHDRIIKLKEELRVTQEEPLKDMEDLQREIKKLEWRIQTTSLALKEEETLIDKIRPLEHQLLIHKKLQNLRASLHKLQTEEEEIESKAKTCHKELVEMAERSQGLHKEMSEALNEADTLQSEADALHQNLLTTEKEAQDFYQQAQLIREELHGMEEEAKARQEVELRGRLEKSALEKLKQGKKLTLEEFKILAEKGII
ncbi:MAG: hypothetical protein JSW53_02875 [Candidatus Bathyarchaeota archaeon]|nr:MAG: hypothetical protein JSW53_02875 [Candidatus Bathyarchaeota archaeon]